MGILFGLILLNPVVFALTNPTVTDLKAGRRTAFQDVLSVPERAVVFIEKDCAPCQAYFRELKNCPAGLTAKIDFVSVSSARKTQEIARWLPKDSGLYLMDADAARSWASATPTTLRLAEPSQQSLGKEPQVVKFVGARGCEALNAWMGRTL